MFGEPHCESVAVKIARAVDFEFNFNLPRSLVCRSRVAEVASYLPVCGSQGHAREYPSFLRRAIRSKPNVSAFKVSTGPFLKCRNCILVCADDCISSKIKPSTLHIRV